MFEKILLPISSRKFPEKALEKSLEIFENYQSEIKIIYIIEKKMEEKVRKVSEYVMTEKQIENLETEIEEGLESDFERRIKEWESEFGEKFSIKEVKGEYSKQISKEIEEFNYDLIIIELEQASVLNYHLLYEKSDIPILIAR